MLRVVRSRDGYLWLGSAEGLVRFDGVRFVRMDSTHSAVFRPTSGASYSTLDDSHPAAARALLTGLMVPLLADRDGVMWVAPPDGRLIRYVDGEFQVVLEHDTTVGRINELIEDGAGRMWALGSLGGRLHSLRGGRLLPPDLPPGVPSDGIATMVPDTGGGVWIGTFRQGLWHVGKDKATHFREPDAEVTGPLHPVLHARDGTLWVQGRTLYRLRGEHWLPFTADSAPRVAGISVAELGDGAVVIATRGDGLLRWKDGHIDRLLERDGLSSGTVNRVLLDDEGSLWATTDAGLDRFRATPFTTLSARNGLPLTSPATLQLDGDGALWVSSSAASNIVHKLDRSRLLAGLPPSVGRVAHAAKEGFYTPLAALPRDGVVLLHNRGALAQFRDGRIAPFRVDGLPNERPALATTTRDGSVWIAFAPHGLGRIRDGRYEPVELHGAERRRVGAIAEDARGHVWVALGDTALLVETERGRAVQRLDAASGLHEPLSALASGPGDTLWGAGSASGALIRIVDDRTSAIVIPSLARLLRGATPTIIAHRDDLWFASSSGIARLSYAALSRARASEGNPEPQFYSAFDGLTVAKAGRMLFGAAVADGDGRIWFSTPAGISVVDPATPRRNATPPRVHIEEVRVGPMALPRVREQPLELPPTTERLDIHFTATALLVPERVRVEYQLVGADRHWVDGSASRVASYSLLRPGRYEFRVRAWNEDGVAGANEASLALTLLPAWYETRWFAALALLAITAAASSGAYGWQRARARRREERMRARFEATLEERVRVARELHDTLLSGFTGITLQLQALQRTIGHAPQRAAESLSEILTSADAALRDARMMIWDMRDSAASNGGLAAALQRAAREAVAGTRIETELVVQGEERPLSPILETTLLRVAREAVTNAVRHAGPRMVRLELIYGADDVDLSVTDDGRGYSPDAAAAAGAAGHWGLSGMRERAARAGGTLSVGQGASEGTTVSVSLPTSPAP